MMSLAMMWLCGWGVTVSAATWAQSEVQGWKLVAFCLFCLVAGGFLRCRYFNSNSGGPQMNSTPSDDLYRQWIQTLPSCLDNSFSEYLEDGRRLCIAAHVRRAGESGIAHKAPYSCVPMRQDQHFYQHQFGELACLAKFTRDTEVRAALGETSPAEAERFAKDWFDAQVEKYREKWRVMTAEAPWEAELQNA